MGKVRCGEKFAPMNKVERERFLGKMSLCAILGELECGDRAVDEAIHDVRERWGEVRNEARARPVGDEVYLHKIIPFDAAEVIAERFGVMSVNSLAESVTLKSFRATRGISKTVKREVVRTCDRLGIKFRQS